MSQAGIVDIIGTHPEIPTMFVANVGSAVPIANTIELLGAAVAAHGVPLQTVASGNTVDFNVQYASAAASSLGTNAGVASFNNTDFSVDANGFVSLTAVAGATQMQVDAFTAPGTNPVIPSGLGIITVTGGQIAAGSTANVIRTNSLAANTYTIQVQRSQAVASSTIADNGVCHFSSAAFSVDANGFVTLAGGGIAVQSFIPNSGTSPVVPNASGQVTWQGTGSITTVGGLNSVTPQLTGLQNHSLLVGAGTPTITNLGVATNGQLPIGSTGADPVLANITSLDGSVTITNGPGSIDLSTNGFLTGTVTTIGNVTGDLITFPLGAIASAYKFHFDVVAYNASTPAALGYAIDATCRTSGVAGTMVGIPDGDEDEDVVLQTDADWDVIASGNDAILRVFGVTGLTLNWKAIGRYVKVS